LAAGVAVAAIIMAVYIVAVAMKLHGSTDPELLRLCMFAVFQQAAEGASFFSGISATIGFWIFQ
jgi:hypothetical protein